VTGHGHTAGATVGLGLGADELVGALLSLDPARRLHLLDSGGARGGGARLLVAGFDPVEYVEAFGDELHLWPRGERLARIRRGPVLGLLDERLGELRPGAARAGALPPEGTQAFDLGAHAFDLGAGGACFVTLSYELARQFERLRVAPAASRDAAGPDAVLAFFDLLVVHDYARGATFLAGADAGRERLRETADELLASAAAWRRGAQAGPETAARPGGEEAGGPHVSGPLSLPAGVSSNFTRGEYEEAVERVREHIRAGDIYQANLTQRVVCPPRASAAPEQVFLRLRSEHPAAFGAFLRQGDRAVVSASPERFLRVAPAGGELGVETWPIKGTRPRGRDAREDARLRAELLASEKDRAENVMIVDLMRNDLGRVCRFGSVEVTELCALQEHPTLFHLVSKVRGVLREGVTAGGLLRAAFPCGSVTGAPKLRAMEILDGIEPSPRGVSMGSLGYFTPGGAADLNVAIRTVTFGPDGAASFHVGGGVVADSSPAAEYDETLVKARAVLRALRAG